MGKIKSFMWFLLSLVAFFFAWNNQSLWIDECCMVMSAAKDSFAEVWSKVTDIGGSDTQMACYLYLLHIWIKLTGADSELLLRLYNIIWVLLAGWFLRKEPKILLVLIISPFFIYYVNEMRPYIMQIAASCGISLFLYKRSIGEKQSCSYGFGLIFLLCTTSLTSVIWAIGFLAAWIILEGKAFWSKQLLKTAALWCIPFVVLGSYYLYTLLLGARAAHIKSNALVNMGASIYELLGLMGCGPARSELRLCTQVGDLLGNEGLLLPSAAGIIIVLVVVWGWFAWRSQASGNLLPALMSLVLIPVSIFIYSASEMDFRFSGRHFAPLLPLICIMVASGMKWSKERPIQGVLGVLVIFIWVAADVAIRFDDTYAREDYRGAIEYCKSKKEEGETVLLLCNSRGKEYYDWKDDVSPADWRQCHRIVVSRPDNFRDIIRQIEFSDHYHKRGLCSAFWVYEQKTDSHESRVEPDVNHGGCL